jgi:hypothetical protein
VKKGLIATLTFLAAASLACTVFVGGPAYPDTSIPAPTGTAQSLQDQIQSALAEGAQTGNVTFQVNESQLTSYLTEKLQSQNDPLISDPQVLLRDGQLKVFAKVQSGIFSANVSLTMQVSVDENGEPRIVVTQTDFGPLPAPQGLNDAAGALVSQILTGSIGPAALGFRLVGVNIADGTMTITGRVK